MTTLTQEIVKNSTNLNITQVLYAAVAICSLSGSKEFEEVVKSERRLSTTNPHINLLNDVSDEVAKALSKAVLRLKSRMPEVALELSEFIQGSQKRLGVRTHSKQTKAVFNALLGHYQDSFQSIYDLNGRAGDLMLSPSISDKKVEFKFDEANPKLKIVGEMLVKLLNPGVELSHDERFDCVISSPVFAKFKNEVESDTDVIETVNLALNSLNPNGIAMVVVPDSFLNKRGLERELREMIVDSNLLEAVITLPGNMYTGSSTATSVLILRENSLEVTMIDLSEEVSKATLKRMTEALSGENNNLSLSVLPSNIIDNDYSIKPANYLAQDTYRLGLDEALENFNLAEEEFGTAYSSWKSMM